MKVRKKRGVLLFLVLVMAAWMGLTVSAAPQSALSQAKENKVSGGTFVDRGSGRSYRKKNGKYLKNTWAMIGGKIYYFDAQERMATGIFRWNGSKYYARKNGTLLRGKGFTYKNSKYYSTKSGELACDQWVRIGGKYYYFRSNGVMAVSRWVGDYYVRADGARVSGLSKTEIKSSARAKEKKNKSRLIIIGASRVYQMQRDSVNTGNALYICKPGQGYSWFINSALLRLKAYLALYPNSVVVLQLGNNDLLEKKDGRISTYISLYENLMESYPHTQFYFMDVLPGNPKTSSALNKRRQEFNKKLKAAFPENTIGGYQYLLSCNPEFTQGGGHYLASTSRKIYRYILKKVDWK